MVSPSYSTSYKHDLTSNNTITLAAFGATGCGKSTFINLISGGNLEVSAGLQSCTQDVTETASFCLEGHNIRIIDTPGFDDTERSDVEILNLIADFMGNRYARGTKLHGILYFYRISDNRMSGASKRSFNLFRKLCGTSSLQNVVIVTTMWDKVTVEEGILRERQLRSDDRFFKSVFDQRAQTVRHHNTFSSALCVLRTIHQNNPIPLAIQVELVDQKKQLFETSAGQELGEELQVLGQKHSGEIQLLKADLGRCTTEGDEKTKEELVEALTKTRAELARVQNELDNLRARMEKGTNIEQVWKTMGREEKVTTMYRRSQGSPQMPLKLQFWSALGDTTKVAMTLSSIFDKHSMPIGLQNELYNKGTCSLGISPDANRELGRWIKSYMKDVENMEAIVKNAVLKAKKKRKNVWKFW